MPILNVNNAEIVAVRMKQSARRTFTSFVREYEQGCQRFWQNSNATPQEISDALGTECAEVFQLHGALKASILAVAPDTELTDVNDLGAFTVNPDGTVTITRVGPA
jgi:hypothetical protein